MQTSRKNAVLTATAVSLLALTQWSLAGDGVSAAGAAGTFLLAQNQPKCGDAKNPCPKNQPQQPQPNKPQPPQPQPKQVQPAQPQPQIRQVQPNQPQPQQPQPKQPQPKQVQPVQPQPQIRQVQPNQPQPQQPQPKQVQPVQPPGQQPQIRQVQPVQPQPQQPQQPQPKQVEPVQPPGQQPQIRQVQPVQPQTQQPQQPQPKQVQPVQPPGQQPQIRQVQPVQPQPQQPQQPQPKQVQPLQPIQPQNGQPAVTFQRRVPSGQQPPGPQGQPGQQRPGAAPAASVVVNVQQLQQERHERVETGGRVVIEEPDHRMIVREGGQAFVRHDETARMFRFEEGRVERRRDGVYNIFVRPDGDEVITITDDDGRLVRRFRRDHFGHEFVLIDNRLPVGGAVFLTLPPPVITIPQDQYIVDTAVAPEPFIYQTLEAPPLVPIERAYTLDEIRFNVALRDRMRRIDVDTINFDFGSWGVAPDQVGRLELIAQAIRRIVARNPNEVFLIEGHTDAVGQDVDNLSLSDRRAETVADILTETFQIPPENLTSQGYGAHFLKIQTPEPNRQNRRVTVRRITPLLTGANS
jgi:outer membrane protein OmpA-like peptidoglycan-associated protein